MNEKTLLLLAAGGLGFFWYRNRFASVPPASDNSSATGFISDSWGPSLPQSIVNSNSPAIVSPPILTPNPVNNQLQTPPILSQGGYMGNPDPHVEGQYPTAPSGSPVPGNSNVIVLPWGMYRPDIIAPGTIHAYEWTSPDLSVNPVTYVRPYISSLSEGYQGAQGFDVSVSLTPGDFSATAIRVQSDPTGTGKLFYMGDQSIVSWVAPIKSNTVYYINIRPLPSNLGLEVWTL